MKRDKEVITLGSGLLYIMELATPGTIPADADIEKAENRIGEIKGGASLEYAMETYTAKDDLGNVQKTKIISEDVLLKSGIMTWNGNTLKKLSATARVTETPATGKRTLKIGGIHNQDGKEYLLRFLHEDPVDGDVRITIAGQNQAGFTLAFAKDAETVVDAEFKANPSLDSEGTLVIIEEEIPVVAG
ncbi:hypothetical protein KCG48_04920 [Proteiniclasticum sp. BAD-10]|uniref:Uncharacterized protein n=1 Tax=Proteiniclasticum sediminis TaxID=2804028 RepID=A0A941HQZ7_9CLOT|nr:hypothetical protein [Proteiniclasticum sediminis]MBR0575682.1 hypothetical protein [Proteiniclasticum sediminis]